MGLFGQLMQNSHIGDEVTNIQKRISALQKAERQHLLSLFQLVHLILGKQEL